MSNNYLQKLNYKIVNVSSSEDDQNNLIESMISFENSWSSERFCSYPQIIIIQFDSPVNLRQINIISHEKKISEKISFFSFCPQKDIFIPNKKLLNFENIGFINFNQNFASNYQVRELKRIFINIKCLYLKIILEKNYINDYNPYHQVGLINIDFFGFKLPGYYNIIKKSQNINKTEEIRKNEEIENNNYNNLIEEISGEKVKQLNNKLIESNKNQNINECILYKELISKAKELGKKIYNLQLEKNEAIKIEDYDKATELKETIDILKSQLYNLGEKQKRNASNENSENNLDNNNINNENDNNLDNQNNQNSNNNTKNNSFFLSNNNSRSFDSYNNNRQSSANSYNNTKNKISEKEPINYKEYDEMVLPAIKNKKMKSNKSQEELELENEELYKLQFGPLEELDKDNIGNYILLVPYIQEFGLQELLSKQIGYKIEGINILKNSLSKIFISSELNKIIPILFELISNFLEEKNNGLTLKTFELIEQIFQYMNINLDKIKLKKKLLNFINNRIIQKLIYFFSDGVEKIRAKASELYRHIIYQNVINFDLLIYNLLDEDVQNKDNAHYFISPNSVLCKLNILKNILDNYSKIINENISTEETFPIGLIIDYLIININNSKNNIKEKCREACLIAFEHFGAEPFKDKFSFLPKKEFEKLFKIKTLQPMMKSINTTSLENNTINKNSNKNSPNNSPSKNKKIQNENKCSLCRQNIGKEKLTEHMKNCPLCCRCKKCKIFVEVKNLNYHKLYDCKYKNEYKLCIRCNEAIYIKSYKIHVDNKKCNPYKANLNRCPLCHKDIPSSNKGFYQHLMKDGCQARTLINNTTEEGV